MVNGVVVLSDPVKAPFTADGDIDVSATVARVTASARERRFFWVFLDHTATVQSLEKVFMGLPVSITPLSLDALIRVFLTSVNATAGG
jgi:hypothetical protein